MEEQLFQQVPQDHLAGDPVPRGTISPSATQAIHSSSYWTPKERAARKASYQREYLPSAKGKPMVKRGDAPLLRCDLDRKMGRQQSDTLVKCEKSSKMGQFQAKAYKHSFSHIRALATSSLVTYSTCSTGYPLTLTPCTYVPVLDTTYGKSASGE